MLPDVWKTKLFLAETEPESPISLRLCLTTFARQNANPSDWTELLRQSEMSLRTIWKLRYAFSAAQESNMIHSPCVSVQYRVVVF